ncbi:hypothetical protein POVWA2_007450 [Plasmodium ovale wallikeri]|uniref:Uncharacterized protein n=1 Tax=Plasmodium ovale wallikeri TaxID=864142 RepID=A0A1A8YIV5_PLAOA|nr:hypothetical protein POVWA1_007310 [Plasmodium ovale wallikeri]SBT32049.1 hypothetical protein POVWA2_007450 [Plasmodium ovale wallikeri]
MTHPCLGVYRHGLIRTCALSLTHSDRSPKGPSSGLSRFSSTAASLFILSQKWLCNKHALLFNVLLPKRDLQLICVLNMHIYIDIDMYVGAGHLQTMLMKS